MNMVIHIMAIVLIISYIVFAGWLIFQRRPLLEFLKTSVCLLGGGIVTFLLSEIVAVFILIGGILVIGLGFLELLFE